MGAPARLQLPPPRARGGARPTLPRPAHPAREGDDEEPVLEKLKGSPSGRLASKARHRTPTSGRNRRSRTPVSPPFQLGGGRRKKGARVRRSRGRWHGLSSRRAHCLRPRRPRRPPLKLPKAEQSSGPDGSEAGAQPGPARRPPHSLSPPRCEFAAAASARAAASRGRTPASRRRAPAPARLPPAQPGPGPREVRTNLGGQPRQLGRLATAYAEAGGGGITCGGRWLHGDAAGR